MTLVVLVMMMVGVVVVVILRNMNIFFEQFCAVINSLRIHSGYSKRERIDCILGQQSATAPRTFSVNVCEWLINENFVCSY